ncbi:NADPH:quinone reductase [Trebonia kvetii]|uniref:NADPH:quinone reductase n=1 Tax=Trebonia kvetii TaxID=2480626 RepID=A0A6P2C7A5_9ACTN|nr:zinc-binding dehydrogenase [Trebonia kvetii]TVZ06375.1 NADPH:quinone reductase [Trebonia kvetii]
MRAIEVRRFGAPDVLEIADLADPTPGPEQLVVASSASDVLFVDTMIRSGAGASYFPIKPPYVPGNGVGGTVVAAGESVGREWLGRRVAAHTGGPGGTGGYAELAVADLEHAIVVPDEVDLLAATAVLHDGTTALRVLETTAPQPGEWVLVLGAAGGMGILLVQLLSTQGVNVVGAARGQAKQDAVRRAGARGAVDYGLPDWDTAVLDTTGGTRPAVVLDGVGGAIGSAAFGLVADGGRFSAHGAPSGSPASIDQDAARRRRVRVGTIRDLQYGPGDRSRLIGEVLRQLAGRRISPLIGQTFSLADAAKAHEAIEGRRTVAKTLLLTD